MITDLGASKILQESISVHKTTLKVMLTTTRNHQLITCAQKHEAYGFRTHDVVDIKKK